MSVEMIISGGTIVDGTGGEPYAGDVAIGGGHILSVGKCERPAGVPVLDATGLLVTPGLIDIHSHSDYTLYVDPRAVSSITQGVTLEVVGNCGHGCAPLAAQTEAVQANIYGYQPNDVLPWHGVGEYLDALAARRPAVNVAALVPNGCLRFAVAGAIDRPATSDELSRMKRLLAEGLDEGAFGYSTGLEYSSERACSEAEVVELCRVTARAGGLYATHTRNLPDTARESIAEAVRTSGASGARLQISHISSVARLADDGRWAVEQALEQVDRAQAEGLDVAFDMHTRSFGMTNLSAVLPPWALEDGKAATVARLLDPTIRRQLKEYPSIVTALARGNWERVKLANTHARSELAGLSIAELARRSDCDPMDAIFNLLVDEIDNLHNVLVLAFVYRPEDTHVAFEHHDCMVGSDATALSPDRPLSGCLLHGAFTWAAWFYRHFVRDTGKLTPQEAVRRLTSLPARRIGLSDRGVISPGACADIAVFDAGQFADRGTMARPDQPAVGMKWVLVNGVVAVRDGVPTGQHAGQVLRRT